MNLELVKMRSHRPVVLMAALLVLLLGYVARSSFPELEFSPRPRSEPPPLPGKNAISGLVVTKSDHAQWMADFDYYYTGQPKYASLRIELGPLPKSSPPRETYLAAPQTGRHHVRARLTYPGEELTTRQVEVKLLTARTGNEVIASQKIEQAIDWPTFGTWVRDQQVAQNTPEANLAHAVQLIDSGQGLDEAKGILERLLRQNSRLDAAYVELARVAMKSNWGPEGFHQAEALLGSAREIDPNGTNAKVLLGYVYAHQRRFAAAETLFEQAAAAHTPNLWVWTNWGEMLDMEGKPDEAAAKYREAIKRPMTHDTYDRARAEAYRRMAALLWRRHDLDGMEALYQKLASEFGPGACYTSDYARFKLNVRGDPDGAIQLARAALNRNCDDSEARQILGLAEYVKWASAAGQERSDAINQARIYLPAGPMPLYLLASSERTVAAAKALVSSGEQIDQKDNEQLTALAHALQDSNLEAARRLLVLGARGDIPVGPLGMPVALLPVMEGDIKAVRLLRQYGTDYSTIRFRGVNGVDVAKQSGNGDLIDAVSDEASRL